VTPQNFNELMSVSAHRICSHLLFWWEHSGADKSWRNDALL